MQSASDSTKPKASADERARLRRNQRNSRARKQEYVQDLEHRWSECVRLGVQASVEIQRGARRCHEENAVLRAVIRELGMSDDALLRRLHAATSARGSPSQVEKNGETSLATYSPASATSPTTSNSTAAAQPSFDQPVVLPFPDSHATDDPSLSSILPLSGAGMSDALQTWNLYSWVNDLANIKDAYSFNAQSQVEVGDTSKVTDFSYHESGNLGVDTGSEFTPPTFRETDAVWFPNDLQRQNEDVMYMQSGNTEFFTQGLDTGVWLPSNEPGRSE